jgi:hypothetical protein
MQERLRTRWAQAWLCSGLERIFFIVSFFYQDKVRRRLLTGLEALSFCEACHVCIEYPAHGTLCRLSQDCHRGTANPVSSVLLRQQNKILRKFGWRTLTLRERQASHAFLERRRICLSSGGDASSITTAVSVHQSWIIVGIVSSGNSPDMGTRTLALWERGNEGIDCHWVGVGRIPSAYFFRH